jgi:hypothetical protein
MDKTELVQSRMLCRKAGDSGASGKCTVVRLIYSSLPPLCLAVNLNIQLKLCFWLCENVFHHLQATVGIFLRNGINSVYRAAERKSDLTDSCQILIPYSGSTSHVHVPTISAYNGRFQPYPDLGPHLPFCINPFR